MSYKAVLKSEVSVSFKTLESLGESTAQASPFFTGHTSVKRSSFWQKTVEIYSQVFLMAKKDALLPFLFILIALLDFAALFALFLAPSPPFSYVVAPIIRAFWGDQFLHYPNNFLLLPKLLNHAHFLITAFFGVFITGLVIRKIEAHIQGEERISVMAAARDVSKKFAGLFFAWLITYVCFAMAAKLVLIILPKNIWSQLFGAFSISVLFQLIAVYTLPAMVILDHGFLKKFLAGLKFGLKNIILTGVVIAIPTLLLLTVFLIKVATPLYVKIYPELVLWILGFGIIAMTFVDFLVTTAAATLFLGERKEG